jgi:hypothetical protein
VVTSAALQPTCAPSWWVGTAVAQSTAGIRETEVDPECERPKASWQSLCVPVGIVSQPRRLLSHGYMSFAYKYHTTCRCPVHGALLGDPHRFETSRNRNRQPHESIQGSRAMGVGRASAAQDSAGQRRCGQGTGLCRHLSRLTRCSPILVSLPFSTFRSPVESRLQISDSKLVLIITKYAYVQRNPANGLGAREIWLLDCYGRPITSLPLPRYLPARTPSTSNSIQSVTGAAS